MWGRFAIFLNNYLHCWDIFLCSLSLLPFKIPPRQKTKSSEERASTTIHFHKTSLSSFPLVSKHIHHPISGRRFKKKALLPGIQCRYKAMKTENVESKSPRSSPLFDVLVSGWLCLGCGCSTIWSFCVKQVWVYCEILKWIEVWGLFEDWLWWRRQWISSGRLVTMHSALSRWLALRNGQKIKYVLAMAHSCLMAM